MRYWPRTLGGWSLGITIFLAPSTLAGYIVTPLVGGQSAIVVGRGNSLSLDIVLTSDGVASQHDSVVLDLIFSAPGLLYTSYEWAAPFPNRGDDLALFDDSVPAWHNLPAILSADSLRGPSRPTDQVDLQLSSLATEGHFGTGRLVTLVLLVPTDYSGPDEIVIRAAPDTFALGFNEVPSMGGAPFIITIPNPGVLMLVAIGCGCGLYGRSRRVQHGG